MDAGPDELRVSVVRGRDRIDLVVPAAVRVAELLPELARRVGGSDPLSDLDDVCLSVVGGDPLDGDAGLVDQGVPDGAVLTVTVRAGDVTPVGDDLATVVAQAVETVPRPDVRLARWSGVGGAVALLGLAAGLVATSGNGPVAVVGAVTSLGLLGAAVVVARVGGPIPVVAAAGWLAVAHAGAAGLASGVVGAGIAWLVAGSAAALLSRRTVGPQLWAAPVAGTVLLAAGLVADLAPAPVPVTLSCALVVVVATGDLQPWLAATVAGLAPPALGEDPTTTPDPVAVAHAVRRAHEVLLVSAVATGLLLGVVGPVATSLGPWGLAVALLCAVVVALRSRRQRVGAGGPAALLCVSVALLPLTISVGWRWPDARVVVVAMSVVVGLAALTAAVLPAPRTVRAGRVAELVEALALAALPATLLTATGLLDVVRALVS